MYAIVLLVLGIVAALAGLATVGLGIPIKEFSLGNTLIIAGTTALASGLVLIGLALAVRQLQRIADAIAPRAPSRSTRPVQNAEAAAAATRNNAGPPRIPFPPRPIPEGAARAVEPRISAPSVDLSSMNPMRSRSRRARPAARFRFPRGQIQMWQWNRSLAPILARAPTVQFRPRRGRPDRLSRKFLAVCSIPSGHPAMRLQRKLSRA
jgi:hypothetical protein